MAGLAEVRAGLRRVTSGIGGGNYQEDRRRIFEESRQNYLKALGIFDALGIPYIVSGGLSERRVELVNGENKETSREVRTTPKIIAIPKIGYLSRANMFALQITGLDALIVRDEKAGRDFLRKEIIEGQVNRISIEVNDNGCSVSVFSKSKKPEVIRLTGLNTKYLNGERDRLEIAIFRAMGFPRTEKRKRGQEYPTQL